MQLIIYASPLNVVGRNLAKKFLSLNAKIQSTCFTSLQALDAYLRHPLGVSPICVLIPSDGGELAALIGIRHLLRDMRIILVLPPNQDPQISPASAHMLRPRFISYADGDMSDVTAVLYKMLGNHSANPIQAVQ